jgi:predicted MPP superfamily phosphohydrolase
MTTYQQSTKREIIDIYAGEPVEYKTISRRDLIKGGLLTATGLALSGFTTVSAGTKSVEITSEEMMIPNLALQFNGMKVTLASDFHSSVHMPLCDLKQIVKRINELQSDVILLPGDFVTSMKSEFPPILEAFSELKAPKGIFATTGNHDHDVDAEMISAGLEDIGITMIRNDNKTIEIGGEKLYLLGIDDNVSNTIGDYIKGGNAPHIDMMFKGVPDDAATILLCHRPYKFDDYAQTGIGLMVSGHTHGGQIVLARIGRSVISLCSLASSFVDGIYEKVSGKHKAKMYVSRGLGVVDIPIRINCPPEITQITLRPTDLAVK